MERARKIIRKAEKDLLQARVKSINSILGNNAKQRDLSRSKLASLVSTTTMDKCQQFLDKVGELRFLKIKERQVNKFNRLLLKQQGNITWFSTVPPTLAGNPPQGDSAVPPQAECTDVQAASASPLAPLAVSAASPQAGSSQAIQASSGSNSLGDNTIPLPRQKVLIPRQPVPLP